MKKRTVALIVFYDEDRRILLQDRRGMNKPAEWGFFGGGLEPGETPEQALVRETEEELSFSLLKFEFLGHFIIINTAERNVDGYVYISPLPEDPDKAFTQREGKGKILVTIAEARALDMTPGDYEVLDALEKKFSNE